MAVPRPTRPLPQTESQLGGPIARTFRVPGVWLGLASTALIGWTAMNPEWASGMAGWGVSSAGAPAVPFDRLLIAVGVIGLIVAWWLVRPFRTSVHLPTTLAIWCLPLLLVAPVLTRDACAYADLGWMLTQGLNPYTVGIGTSPGPFTAQVDPFWVGTGTAYPPLALEIARIIVVVTHATPYWTVVAMRVPVLVSVGVMVWVVPKLAEAFNLPKDQVTWLAVLNPLVVVYLVGGMHNDAPMIAVTLVAVWLVTRWPQAWMSLLVAPIVIGVAMALKQQAGLAVIAVAGLPVMAQLGLRTPPARVVLLAARTVVAAVVAAASFAVISLVTGLGFGWVHWLNVMGKAGTLAPLALISKWLSAIVAAHGGDPARFMSAAGVVTVVIVVGVVVWLFIRFADRPLVVTAWGALAVAVLGQALHPWYLPWGLALFGITRTSTRQRRWVWGVVIAFVVVYTLQTAFFHTEKV